MNASLEEFVSVCKIVFVKLCSVTAFSWHVTEGSNYCWYLDQNHAVAIDKLAYVISRYLNIFAFHFEVKIDLQVTMPHSYPYVALQMFARSPELDRQQQLLLNKSLASYIGTFDPGELCVCAAIQWLQNSSASYFLNRESSWARPSTQAKPVKNTFLRMWIYSHHIYQQDTPQKDPGGREEELDVTGFFAWQESQG